MTSDRWVRVSEMQRGILWQVAQERDCLAISDAGDIAEVAVAWDADVLPRWALEEAHGALMIAAIKDPRGNAVKALAVINDALEGGS